MLKNARLSAGLWRGGSQSAVKLCSRSPGDVPGRNRRDPGYHRAHAFQEDPGAPVQADLHMCGQATLPGTRGTPGEPDLGGGGSLNVWERFRVKYMD